MSFARAEPVLLAVRPLSAALPIPDEMYDKSGFLNRERMQAILRGMKGVIEAIGGGAKGSSRAKIEAILERLEKHQDRQLCGDLKALSAVMRRESKALAMQSLSAVVFQMARVHSCQVGWSKYDDAAETIGKQIAAQNQSIDNRSLGYVSDSMGLTLGCAAKLGLQMGAAKPCMVSAGINLGVSNSRMVINDLNTELQFIARRNVGVDLSLAAEVGKIAGNAFVTMSGVAGANGTHGWLIGAATAEGVIKSDVKHRREGGDRFAREMNPTPRELRALANIPTQGVRGRVAKTMRSAIGWATDGRFVDPDRELNTHKLIKGAIAKDYLYGEDSLFVGFPELSGLRQQFESAYGRLFARALPSSLKPVDSTGAWFELGCSVSGDIGVLKGQVANYLKLTGLDVNAKLSYSRRSLPCQSWMAPHVALEALADENVEVKKALLEQILKVDPSVSAYLEETKSFSLHELQVHLELFEDHAMRLLTAQGILRGYVDTPRDLRPPEVLSMHASQRFDASLDKLKDVFRLSDTECEGVIADSNKVEGLLARCWNRLSLSLAQVSLYLNSASGDSERCALAQRIEKPNILMAPEHFYHAATLQMEKTITRSRVTGDVGLALPTIVIGGASCEASVSCGAISGRVTYDRVAGHHNFVRNGDFLTFDMRAEHPLNADIAGYIPRAIAKAIAERFQACGDNHQLNKLDQVALEASLSEAYLTCATDVAKGAGGGGRSVLRQFEVSLHRSAEGALWRLAYFQASSVQNSGISGRAGEGIVLGVGGGIEGAATYRRSDSLVMPPILGSAPSVHILQARRFEQAFLKQENGRWQIDPYKLDVDALRTADVASMYFSNDALVDTLDLLLAIKGEQNEPADVFGGLADLGHNAAEYKAFRKGGMSPQALRSHIDIAREKTKGLPMADRLNYFATNPIGQALLEEYGYGIMQFAAMKGRAVYPYPGTDGRAMTPSILTASKKKVPLEMPELACNKAFKRDLESRKAIRGSTPNRSFQTVPDHEVTRL